MFNEPLHGEEYRGRYDDIWNRVFNEFKAADPNVQLMVNDYNIAKADCGQCIVDLVKGWDKLTIGSGTLFPNRINIPHFN